MSGGLGGGLPHGQQNLQQWQLQQQQMLMQAQAQQNIGSQHIGSPVWAGGNSTWNVVGAGGGLMRPDPMQSDTLGWREWSWSDVDKMLKSPSTGTLWPEAELVVPVWDESDVVRGVSGIHAHLVPKHWKILGEYGGGYVGVGDPNRVHGIVERFGKYVLGTEGWRAEWVIIKELMAPSTEVGLEIERVYPDVIVHYPEEEGEESCASVKSSKWGKGNRLVSRPRPSPPPSPSSSPASQPLTQTMVNPLANQFMPSQLQNVSASWSQSSLGASPQSPSRSENSRRINRFIYKWFWAIAGLSVAAFFRMLDWALS